MKLDIEEAVEYMAFCEWCAEDIEELEAHRHTFIVGGYPIYYHESCCPIYLENGLICTSDHE